MVYFLRLILFFFFCTLALTTRAQVNRTEQQNTFQLQIAKANEPPKVDGRLDDPCWKNAAVATNFAMKWPRDGGPAPAQTEVRCAYDARFLYIGVLCHDSSKTHVINSLKRDVGYWDSDGFAVILDPVNNATNGYFFGINAAGAQTEGLLSSAEEMDTNWDNTWFVETEKGVHQWTAEYAIPLRILRYNEGQAAWGINFIRNDLRNGIYSVWAAVPFQFDGTDVGWTGSLRWDAAPRKVKGNYNLIPYVTANASRDYEGGTDWQAGANAGIDAKIGIGSGLNLDVTVNPDFSQTEIDEQLVNLTRFDLQLPEKRTFFLENADIFGNFGIPPVRPFFSRTIGLTQDGAPVPIYGGLRLTGNLNSNTRVGLMTMQTRQTDDALGQNYTALSLNRRLFGRTTVAGYFLDREIFDGSERLKNQYSRNAGMEFVHTSLDGKWSFWATHHRSDKAGARSKNWWGNSGGQYSSRRFNVLLDFLHMGENYHADLGFERRIENYDLRRDSVLRIGYNFVFSNFEWRFFPKKKDGKLNFASIGGELFNVFNPDRSLNESSNSFNVTWNFKNTSEFSVNLSPNFANVPVYFKFDDEADTLLCPALPPARYQWAQGGFEWSSDYRKTLVWSTSLSAGQFYNGKQYSLSGSVTYRLQPIANITLRGEFNQLDFPAPYCDVALFNLTPRIEIFFAKNLWWTTFLQYNTQADNFNVNSRLQWRFRPMSDIFVVYTDNYAVQQWGVRNRSLAVKGSYWF
jgi:hypothetical protein